VRRHSIRLIVLLGIVSLLADVTYEGARSLSGPFLATLGAGAVTVGFAAGAGEFLGHILRLGSGWLADRTRRYWLFTLAGYSVNLAAVPLLALAANWQTAVVLLLTERTGKAIRTPSRDVMLSHAAHNVGRGWGFGLHEAMDQIGAVAGPLLVAWVLVSSGDYRPAFAVLALPAVLALAALLIARSQYPAPRDLEPAPRHPAQGALPRAFWLYVAAAGLLAAGTADFALVAFHGKKLALVADHWIPLLYAAAMGVDALSALVLGRLFDRHGVAVLGAGALLGALAAPLAFSGGIQGFVAGILVWGAATGALDSTVKAAVAEMVPADMRGVGFGIFHAGFGVCWFLGSLLTGWLYDSSPSAAAIAAASLELCSLPLLIATTRALAKDGPAIPPPPGT
jgi:MFS family permease